MTKDNLYLRLVMKVLMENIGRDKLIVYRSYDEFIKIYENDPDFGEHEFESAAHAVFDHYQKIAPTEKELTNETLLRVALEVVSRAMAQNYIKDEKLRSELPEKMIESFKRKEQDLTTNCRQAYLEDVANSLGDDKLPVKSVSLLTRFHEVAFALVSLDRVSMNPLLRGAVDVSKKTGEKYEEGSNQMALYKQQVADMKQQYTDNLNKYLQMGYSSLSVDRLYEKVTEGRNSVQAKFDSYVDTETLYHPFNIAKEKMGEFTSSDKSTIELIKLNTQIASDVLAEKRGEFATFINERKYRDMLSPEVLEMLDNGYKRTTDATEAPIK